MKHITEEDTKRVNELLVELDAILQKYEDFDYRFVTSYSRMIGGYYDFKEWFGYWSKQ